MDLILCHTTADFDTLGGAVGLSRLLPGARIVLTGGSHPTVKDFLALHRDEYALIERRSVTPEQIRSITVVDTQWHDRLGKAAEWLDLPEVEIRLYDHHTEIAGDISAAEQQIEAVGAATTLIVERLQAQQIALTVAEATVMALGIHVDTGSLTFDHATARDAAALTWLMQQGANLRTIAEYVEPGLSPPIQDLLATALEKLETETLHGCTLAWVVLAVAEHLPGLSQLASRLMSLTEADVLLLAVQYPVGEETRLTLIGRSSSLAEVNLATLFQPFGGGGHAKAAALTLRGGNVLELLQQLLVQLRQQIPHPPIARELMSSPVRTIRPETTIADAQRILLRYGHSGLSVVDTDDRLVGVISRRDLDIALHHGFAHAPVKGYMTTNLKTIAPDTPLPEIEALMVTYDIGRLPVLSQDELVGIVTRTDVLRQLHQGREEGWQVGRDEGKHSSLPRLRQFCVLPNVMQQALRDRLIPALWQLLQILAQLAEARGWQLYVVGGAVRDLLLAQPDQPLLIQDIDLVVDGFHRSADQAAGVELAKALQTQYPKTRLQIHGQFQTAALLWHNDPVLDSLWIDIATARTEFYPYPAANPEVEASSIRQDLYRRDFTINALAVRLTSPRAGELLDFFGGVLDLEAKQIRVLHPNSFIEDPTRIYRAVRFAVRLGFQIEPQTEGYIRYAIASGVYDRTQLPDRAPALQTRLKQELKYILQAPYWQAALRLLADLDALVCIHPDLHLSPCLWWQMRLVDRWLKRFDPQETLTHWQTLLEVLLVALQPADRLTVAQTLQLPADSGERLDQLQAIQTQVEQALPLSDRPSQVVQLLSPYDHPTLILLGATSSRSVRRQIWRYFTRWSTVKPPLDGNDLRALGYKPGKQFKVILEALRTATLDGAVGDRQEAEMYLKTHFPLL
ncbi:CBS domain-containing protein [Phormidium tenue FACHB-886]|nr:CBS domain-containing protein [Phormidium tenue FACHB-886]